MKYFWLFALLAPLFAQGQITITSADMPVLNDTIRVSRTNLEVNPSANLTATGENVALDFSNLDPGDQDVIRYVSSLQTPYAFYFFNSYGAKSAQLDFLQNVSTALPITVTNLMDFYKNSPSKFVTDGRGLQLSGIPLAGFFTDPDEIYQFPLEYGRVDTSTFNFNATIPTQSGGYKSSGTRINTVDGWGKITVPTGTYDCIRVKSEITFNDVVTIPDGLLPLPIPFPIPPINLNYRRIEYKWLAKNKKIPVVQVNVTLPPFGGQGITEVIYQDVDRLPKAGFLVTSEAKGCRPLSVTFQNTSKQFTNCVWDFGDGTTSTQTNPTHTYYTKGKFNVKLTVSNNVGQDEVVKNNAVNVSGVAVDFFSDRQTAKPNENIYFYNNTVETETGLYIYRWNFGDGGFSASLNPIYAYAAPGVYTVRMTVVDPTGCRDTVEKKSYITVKTPVGLADEFETGLTLYPNPAAGQIAVRNTLTPAPLTLEIFAPTGQKVKTLTLSQPEETLSLDGLAAGVYSFKFYQGTQMLGVKKVAVQ